MIFSYDKVMIMTTIVLAKCKYKQTQMAHLPALVSDDKVKKK